MMARRSGALLSASNGVRSTDRSPESFHLVLKSLLKNYLAKRLVDKMESGVDRERSSHSFRIVAIPKQGLQLRRYPSRSLSCLSVFDDGAVFRSLLVVSKSFQLDRDTNFTFLSSSDGPETRSPITEVPFALFVLSISLRRWRSVPLG